MKTLTLSLKKQWFDMIKAGVKKEEYREMKPYWTKRMMKNCIDFTDGNIRPCTAPKDYDRLVFTLGYPKAGDTERRLAFKNPKIRIGTGRLEWGAESGKNYFVITWEG